MTEQARRSLLQQAQLSLQRQKAELDQELRLCQADSLLFLRDFIPAERRRLIADADACRSMGLDRRPALWDARRVRQGVLPLFGAANRINAYNTYLLMEQAGR